MLATRRPTLTLAPHDVLRVRITSRPDTDLDDWLSYEKVVERDSLDNDVWPYELEWTSKEDMRATLEDVMSTLCTITHAARGDERKMSYLNDWFVGRDIASAYHELATEAAKAVRERFDAAPGPLSVQAKAANIILDGCLNRLPELYGKACPHTVADVFFSMLKLERALREMSDERIETTEAHALRSTLHVSLLKKLFNYEFRHGLDKTRAARDRSEAVRHAYDEILRSHLKWRRRPDAGRRERLDEATSRETLRSCRAELAVIRRGRQTWPR